MSIAMRDGTTTVEQHSVGALSPLRKAMSLGLLFRNNASPPVITVNSVISAPVPEHTPLDGQRSPSSTVTTPPTISKPLGRVRRRLSLRSTSASPATSSSLTSPTLSTPPTSASSSSSVRGRPRSGSCRSSFLGGSGGGIGTAAAARILPFTLPTLGQTYEEGGSTRFGADMIRTSSSGSPSDPPPKRPLTPAPLLVLDEAQDNCLGIAPESAQRAHGLGLSAPALSSRTSFTNPISRISLLTAAMESKESFQCRGEREDPDALPWDQANVVKKPLTAPQMTRSASANPVSYSTSSSSASTSAAMQPSTSATSTVVLGSPLGWRRRPWALSLQLQSSSASSTLPTASVVAPPHSAKAYVKGFSPVPIVDDENCDRRTENAPWTAAGQHPRSRFSLSSSNIDMNEETTVGNRGFVSGASQTTSPTFTWSSSANSFDTTLESPESRHSNRFSVSTTDRGAPAQQQQRGRSNTIAAIPYYPGPKDSIDNALLGSSTCNDDDDVATAATSFDDSIVVDERHRRPSWIANEIASYCPSSPPSHVRLRLTLPPTAVAKHAGVPYEQTMQMPMTASTLDFKEAICLSLRARHRLSISPSQVALFVVMDSDEITALSSSHSAASPGLLPLSPRLTNKSMLSVKRAPPSSPTSPNATFDVQQSAGGLLRPRSRLRRRLSVNQPASATVAQHVQSHYRQLQNDAVLYQEGLQDDDNVIVRF